MTLTPKRPGRKPTTGRGLPGARQVAMHLSAEEYARVKAAAGEQSVTGWCTRVVLGAMQPQRVSVDGGPPYVLPADGIIRGGAR